VRATGEGNPLKIVITVKEAIDRGVWPQIMKLFGRDDKDDVWPNEEFILTEEQAKKLGLIR
jgi:hypothetical protein